MGEVVVIGSAARDEGCIVCMDYKILVPFLACTIE